MSLNKICHVRYLVSIFTNIYESFVEYFYVLNKEQVAIQSNNNTFPEDFVEMKSSEIVESHKALCGYVWACFSR